MQIGYLAPADLETRHAHCVHIMNMCQALQSLNNEVTLFVRAAPDSTVIFEKCNIKSYFRIMQVPTPAMPMLGGFVFGARAIQSGRRSSNIELWYCRHIQSALVAAAWGLPCVLEIHGLPPRGITRKLVDRLFVSASFRALVVITEALRRDALAAFPSLKQHQVILAPDAAPDFPMVQPIELPTGGRPAVGYVGHLYPGKGIEIIARVAALVPDMSFHVVGGMPEDIERWRASALPENLTLHGHCDNSMVPRHLSAFDVVLLPNQSVVRTSSGSEEIGRWTSPLKLFEYMSAQKAIIASRLPVIEEVLTDGENALLADPSDPEEWAHRLRLLIGSPELRAKLGARARSDFVTHYSWPVRVRHILESI